MATPATMATSLSSTIANDSATLQLRRLVLILIAILLTLTLLGITGAGIWLIGRRFGTFTPSYSMTVRFPDANGVHSGDEVTMAGVVVGHVESAAVEEDGRGARVRLRLRNEVKVPRGSRFVAQPVLFSMPGGIEILPSLVPAGSADTDPGRTRQTLAAQDILPADDARQGDGEIPVGEARPNVAATFGKMNAAVTQWENIGRRSEILLDEAARTTSKISALTTSSQAIVGDPETVANIKGTLRSLRTTTQRADQAMAAAAPLLDDPTTANDLRATVRSAKQVAAVSAQLLGLLEKAAAKKK